MMKKLLLPLLVALSLAVPGLALSGTAQAVDVLGGANGPCANPAAAKNNPACADNNKCPANDNNCNPIYGPHGIMTTIVRLLSLIVGIAAVFVIIISAINFITSGGDSSKVASARSALIFALVGILVAALGQILVVWVLDRIQ